MQLYNLVTDISEKQNVAAQPAELVTSMTALLKKTVADGRSTPGKPQQNDVEVDLYKKARGQVRQE